MEEKKIAECDGINHGLSSPLYCTM